MSTRSAGFAYKIMRDRDASFEVTVSRSRVARIVWVAALASLCACSGDARHEVIEQASADLEVSEAASPLFTRRLPPGTYLVEVREDEIDLRVQIDTGAAPKVLSDQVPRHGTIYAVVVLPGEGNLNVQLRNADHKTKHGRAHLTISRWERAAAGTQTELERGFVAFDAAGQQCALGTPQGWARAADKLYEAVTHFTSAHDAAARAQAAYSLASIQYNVRDEWAAAVRATEIASEAYAEAGDELGARNATTLRAAADIEIAGAMDSSTHGAEQKALYASIDRRLGDAADYFTTHRQPVRAEYAVNMRAVCAVNVGDYSTAEKLFEHAVDLARKNQDVAEQARSLGNLASVHNMRGFVAQSAHEYESLIPIVDHESYQYALLLANYGFTLIALGEFDRALEMHLEALARFTKMGEESERATALAALGGLYLRMGDAGRALETLRSAVAAQKHVGNSNGVASALRVAANAASQLGDHNTALDYLREAARIDNNPHKVALTNVLIAGQLRALGKYADAAAELTGPLQSPNALARANALEERAQLHMVQQDLSAAVRDLRDADRQYASLGLDYNRVETNTTLSRALLAVGNVPDASKAADEAISIVSRIRVKSANPEWRARFLSARYSPFEARIAVDLADDSAGAVEASWRAFRTAEGVRARSLHDELSLGASPHEQVESAETAALRARLTSLQLKLETRMQRQNADEAGVAALQRSILETRAQIESNRLREGGVAARETALPSSLAEVRAKLPPDTAVLAYFVGDLRAHGWLLSRTGLRHIEFDAGTRLEKTVDAAVAAERASTEDGAARNLSTMVLRDLLAGSVEHRILVIADGPLNGVPFAALPVPGGNGLLLDNFVLSYAPSLALVLGNTHAAHLPGARVAVISDPVYAPDDRRLRLAEGATPGTYRGPPPPRPDNLTRLPYSAMEASAVAKALGASDTIELSGFDATTEKILGLAPKQLRVLHFATHAVARRDAPEQSALYLTQFAPDGTPLASNQLAAKDIQRSGLRADLVVLSGCATGDGSELRGEGVLGLTYGFLANGSRAVVAALWPIEDASTARFMSEFYRAYRASGSAADALRSAQLTARGTASAAVWSSFVVRANEYP
ncbi:MAG TPA: CHAT domain-containing tetratricopeptide repeat protein [Steroidobacteraceae bacterium]|nr:CHAT domain-containing tetratricopeptide repeat protein [Steroidobacteraceae bacterium]